MKGIEAAASVAVAAHYAGGFLEFRGIRGHAPLWLEEGAFKHQAPPQELCTVKLTRETFTLPTLNLFPNGPASSSRVYRRRGGLMIRFQTAKMYSAVERASTVMSQRPSGWSWRQQEMG
mmetsp:Transcript_72772/g.131075  ORF Transcript_72772/g.131075 Transcript_72772/m.131075 type:complete len:119 (-) Transcript_72772:38-394(-)